MTKHIIDVDTMTFTREILVVSFAALPPHEQEELLAREVNVALFDFPDFEERFPVTYAALGNEARECDGFMICEF